MNYVLLALLVYAVVGGAEPAIAQGEPETRTVVLLHGLARSGTSMRKMQSALEKEGFHTCNIAYPSTKHRIETLVKEHVLPQIQVCVNGNAAPVDFVTHSMGGILVRYLAAHDLLPLGRVVMLSPPNQGSEVVDKLGKTWLFEQVNGPAGKELGTDSSSVPVQLGPAAFEVGIITGSRSINPILSMMIDGKDDGKVSIARAKLAGMKGFVVVPATHPFIMKNRKAIAQTIYFLKQGEFRESDTK